MSSRIEQGYSRMRFLVALILVVIWSILMPIVYFLSLLVPFYDSQRLPGYFHWGVCKIIGLDVEFIGTPTQHKPTLFVSNHVSYLDIFALGQKISGFFVAKSEVGNWPVLNRLARLQKTVFIERKSGKAKSQIQQLRQILLAGNNLILFPEGTSTNGAEVLSFKSSLFAAVENNESNQSEIWVQPVSIVYTQFMGEGMSQSERDCFAWYADMPFGAHFAKMMGLGKVKAVVTFSEPIKMQDYDDRKACAVASEESCRATFTEAFQQSGSEI